MIHEVLAVGPLQCNCSILGDETSREGIVVDPGAEVDRILTILAAHRLTLKQIVVTHAHIDHIAGARRLQLLTGAPILYNEADLPLVSIMDVQAGWLGIPVPDVTPPDLSLADGSTVAVTGIACEVLHTPGHTEGSLCLYLPVHALLLAGDTLFAGSIGRTDLPGGNMERLLRSIHGSLLPLPDVTRVLPGHGPAPPSARNAAAIPFCSVSDGDSSLQGVYSEAHRLRPSSSVEDSTPQPLQRLSIRRSAPRSADRSRCSGRSRSCAC